MKNLEFKSAAFDDLLWWVEHDRKKAVKIFKLIKETCRTPFEGSGDPEALKHDLAGCWSRRIDKEHRLVYKVIEEKDKEGKVCVIACRYHYE